MRVFNNRRDQLDLPLAGDVRISISGKSISENILGTTEFLTRLITTFTTDEIAFIVSGPFELSMCANIPTCTNYVVQSVAEAVERFRDKSADKKEEKAEVKVENAVEEPKQEEVKEEVSEPTKAEETTAAPKAEKKKKTKSAK